MTIFIKGVLVTTLLIALINAAPYICFLLTVMSKIILGKISGK